MSQRTHYADEYIEAWNKSRTHDLNSLVAHWEAGYKFAEYGEHPADIAADVGISRTSVYDHIKLYNTFPNAEQLLKLARKHDSYNYIFLVRQALDLPPRPSPAMRIWACSRCGCRELIEVHDG